MNWWIRGGAVVGEAATNVVAPHAVRAVTVVSGTVVSGTVVSGTGIPATAISLTTVLLALVGVIGAPLDRATAQEAITWPFAVPAAAPAASATRTARPGGTARPKTAQPTSIVWAPWGEEVEAPVRPRPNATSRPRGGIARTDVEDPDIQTPARAARERREQIRRRESWTGKTVAPHAGGRWQWKVTKVAWTDTDEAAFGEFLRLIGESGCKTTHECLTSPVANPHYHQKNPPGWQFFADCADLPFVLRGYFAWMNELPYSYSTALALGPRGGTRSGAGVEFPSFQIAGRRDIVPPGPDGRLALADIAMVSTGHFRTAATYQGRFLPDHYPVKVTRESVKAGTVMFDPLGHIAVIYKVTDDGHVHFIDAHPDNSLTRGTYGSEIERAGPDTGAGFRRWRPQRLVGAVRLPNGQLSGGEIVLTPDKDLADWSDEQYYGVGAGRAARWEDGKYDIGGDPIDYYGFVRLRLAKPGFRYDPVVEVRTKVATLCQELGYRVDAVQAAVKAGIDRLPQPARLPTNIYVTQGLWETYATPSRDAQLKTMFKTLREDIERFIALAAAGSKLVAYTGDDLRRDMLAAHTEQATRCTITYVRSNGTPQPLSFDEAKRRLFRMSFDPHHCAERRWGADDPAELASCTESPLKKSWYEAQQRLRNQLVRTIGDRMNFTLADLVRQAEDDSDVGENDPPVISVAELLNPS